MNNVVTAKPNPKPIATKTSAPKTKVSQLFSNIPKATPLHRTDGTQLMAVNSFNAAQAGTIRFNLGAMWCHHNFTQDPNTYGVAPFCPK
jgi:hypothetical protein